MLSSSQEEASWCSVLLIHIPTHKAYRFLGERCNLQNPWWTSLSCLNVIICPTSITRCQCVMARGVVPPHTFDPSDSELNSNVSMSCLVVHNHCSYDVSLRATRFYSERTFPLDAHREVKVPGPIISYGLTTPRNSLIDSDSFTDRFGALF
jgi:hypothetical protein